MNAWWQYFLISLRLQARNPMALLYGYAFPLIFLVAFRVLYRHEAIPLLLHLGQLLTVTVLGGACFGLPTTLVSERERGLWRRYRLTPVPVWTLVATAAMTRYLLVLSAGLLQFFIALALGMTSPAHPFGLWVAFTCVAFSSIGLGLVLAMLADTVPAVQALGQCIFLPMLIIGGVAVPLATLPEWAQQLSAFFPGRHAVVSLQSAVTGDGLTSVIFPLLALLVMGAAAIVASMLLFRWESGQRFATSRRRGWLLLVAAAWIAVGVAAERPFFPSSAKPANPVVLSEPASIKTVLLPVPALPSTTPKTAKASWRKLTRADAEALNFDVSPDDSVVNPFAGPDEDPPFGYVEKDVNFVRDQLPGWLPAQNADPVRAILSILCVPAAADLLQLPSENYLPPVVMNYLVSRYSETELMQALTWIALHPDEGDVVLDFSALGIEPAIGSQMQLRQRVQGYALKFVGRLIGRLGPDAPAQPEQHSP